MLWKYLQKHKDDLTHLRHIGIWNYICNFRYSLYFLHQNLICLSWDIFPERNPTLIFPC